MWENTVAIHNILKEKKLQSEIFNQLNIKKVKSTKIILEKQINKKKGKVGKKESTFEKKKKKETEKKGESWKKKRKSKKKNKKIKTKIHYKLLL
jgi:ribosomal protein L22